MISNTSPSVPGLPSQDDWYRDAVIYELHVRAFRDANGDGIGDFAGLTEKLGYLKDLGITALWLLPFYPSPLRDDGYDISDYTGIHPSYGNVRDFRRFLREAHRLGLRVITELVINHTSNEHGWFQRARRAPPGSRQRDFYVWTHDPGRFAEARVIFNDFETSNWSWDPVAGAYYWHRFFSHQPDLNFDNPHVHQAVFKVVDYWLGMGVDGLRLDAVPYLYEREGTSCENLQETHSFLRQLRRHIDGKYSGRMLLAEANQWPEDAAAYFGSGDECHMCFHFPLMPRMFMALQLEDSMPITDVLGHTPVIPENCQWATFLRNHDELTLEMVTDEERDYMYRVYAGEHRSRINLGIRRRLAPLLRLRRKQELMHGLLLSLPGAPVLYYGDEIGMGDNIYLGDRNGVRTPMQWSGDRNAGFSSANPQKLYLPPITDPEYHYQALNVEAQVGNPSSLLSWMKRVIALRQRHPVFSRGSLRFVPTGNPKVLAFVREHAGDRILVAANLSRFMQYTHLDLSGYQGSVPVELFGRNAFPAVTGQPYLLSLGPHGFCWFALEHDGREAELANDQTLEAHGDWRSVLTEGRSRLEKALPDYLIGRRWFRSKSRHIRSATFADVVPLPGHGAEIAIVRVEFSEGEPETYVLPLAFAVGAELDRVVAEHPGAVVARLVVARSNGDAQPGALYDASASPDFARALLEAMRSRAASLGRTGALRPHPLKRLRQIPAHELEALPVHVGKAEQSNTSVLYGDRFILKLFRRLEPGINPDIEIGRFLTEQNPFSGSPDLEGYMEYRSGSHDVAAFAMLQDLVAHQGDGWEMVLRQLEAFVEQIAALGRPPLHGQPRNWTPEQGLAELGPFLRSVELLGRRTGELHRALAGVPSDPAFAREEFSMQHQRSLYEGARARLSRAVALLERRLGILAESSTDLARQVLSHRAELDARLRRILGPRFDAARVRCHGDYHLGQVLYTGTDFVIIDFEGEPGRPLGERRFKRSPLVDVAGMLRSFHYAATTVLRRHVAGPPPHLRAWIDAWHGWVTEAYLGAYFESVAGLGLLPSDRAQLDVLLDFFIIDKCLYEVIYEVNNRPDWVQIPLEGLWQVLTAPPSLGGRTNPDGPAREEEQR